MFSLKLFGGASLEGPEGRITGPAIQRHRLAILALLAGSRRGLSRDRVMAWLWPESDTEHARRLLNQAVHVLRRELGAEAILSVGEELQLDPALVASDVMALEEAHAAGDLERCVALYAGPFLDGFFLSEAPEFDQWLDRERNRLAAVYARALQGLAERAEATGDRLGAVRWWKAKAALDPYDSSAALRLILALEASGNRAAALLEAGAHQRLLKDELDMAPPPELMELAGRLRTSPAPMPLPMVRELETDVAPTIPPTAPEVFQPSRARPLLPYAAAAMLVSIVLLVVALFRSRPANLGPGPGTVSASSVDEIAQAVARELDKRQRGDTAMRRAPQRTRSIPAYELYLRGSDPAVLRSDSAARQGLEYFRRAVALDSTYAAAWAGVARMTLRTSRLGVFASRVETLRAAEAAANRALALDDSLGEAHATLALVRVNHHDMPGAESEFRRAIALDPGAARNHEYLVRLYLWWGRGTDALAAARHALELEPLSATANAELARAFLANRRYDEALVQLNKVAATDPPLQRAATIAAQCYAGKKMWKQAIATLRSQGEQAGGQHGLLGYLLARGGQPDEARQVLATLRERDRSRGGQALDVALVYAGLSEVDSALAWLQRAVDDQALITFAETAPTVRAILDSHPRDPRVLSLRKSLGL